MVLSHLIRELSDYSDTAELDAEILLCHVLNCTRLQLVLNENQKISNQEKNQLDYLIERRKQGEPIAYIIGKKEFYGRDFIVNRSVLCPRPETELIIDLALKYAKNKLNFIDLGTGSGCIASTLALELSKRNLEYNGVAVDISPLALETAEQNFEALNVKNVKLLESNWFENIGNVKFDLIVSNPPYVDKSMHLAKDLSFEPEVALFANDSGLKEIQNLIMELPKYLSPNGVFLCEIGSEQADKIIEFIKKQDLDYTINVHKDLAGLDRIIEIN
jgi:release factor glutamine methyltransferase